MAMFGNGVWIIGTLIIKTHPRMEVPGSKVEPAITEFYAAVLGSTIRGIVGLRIATTAFPPTATASTVFGCSASRPGLSVALCPLALLPSALARSAKNFLAKIGAYFLNTKSLVL